MCSRVFLCVLHFLAPEMGSKAPPFLERAGTGWEIKRVRAHTRLLPGPAEIRVQHWGSAGSNPRVHVVEPSLLSSPPQTRAAGGGQEKRFTLRPVGRPHSGSLAGGEEPSDW